MGLMRGRKRERKQDIAVSESIKALLGTCIWQH